MLNFWSLIFVFFFSVEFGERLCRERDKVFKDLREGWLEVVGRQGAAVEMVRMREDQRSLWG